MMFSTTPFPVTTDYSQWYWDPSTFTWLPSAPPTSPFYSDPCYSYNTSTSPNYSYPTAATDYTLDPYSHVNHGSYDGYINYHSPNYVSGYAPSNTSTYSPPMMSSALARPVVPAPCAPPALPTPPPAVPRECGNCGTTESCKWKNVKSKDNLRCNTCYKYRLRNKKERPADVIQVCNQSK